MHRTSVSLATALGVLLATSLHAQLVRGSVVSSEGGAPVSSAVVALLDSTARRVTAVYSDSAGNFALRAPQAGSYSITVLRIGFRPFNGDSFEVGSGGTSLPRIVMSAVSQLLPEIQVRGSSECIVKPEESTVAFQLWSAARSVLAGTIASAEEKRVVMQYSRYTRLLDERSQILQDSSVTRSVTGAIPFAGAKPAELLAKGYARIEGGSWNYYGPDANVFLDESFAETHCLRVPRTQPRGDSLLYLEFEPIRSRTLTDIKGRVTLVRATGGVQSIDFTFTGRELPGLPNDAGGFVEFRQVDSGRWIVGAWEIRMPMHILLRRPRMPDMRVGYKTEGGMVTSVHLPPPE